MKSSHDTGSTSKIVFALLAAAATFAGGLAVTLTGQATLPINESPPLQIQDDLSVGSEGEIVIGSATAAAKLRVSVDYRCADCAQWILDTRNVVDEFVRDGSTQLRIQPVARLDDQSSGTEYSTRAASAAYCVANYSGRSFDAYNLTLLQRLPQPDLPGPTNRELSQWAAEAGADLRARRCIETGGYEDFAREMTEAHAPKRLPSVSLNGQELGSKALTAAGLAGALTYVRGPDIATSTETSTVILPEGPQPSGSPNPEIAPPAAGDGPTNAPSGTPSTSLPTAEPSVSVSAPQPQGEEN